jgi:general secretion pathway protein H
MRWWVRVFVQALIILGAVHYKQLTIDGLVKSQKSDDNVKSFRCKARKYEGMRRTCVYAAMTEDAAQRSRWTFHEVVNDRWMTINNKHMHYRRFSIKGFGLSASRGFTLLELILVLVIMGFLTALVAPAITSLSGLKLKTAARKVAAGLRYARSQAVTSGCDYQVVFDFEKREMMVERLEEEVFYKEGEREESEDPGVRGESRFEGKVLPSTMERQKTFTLPKEVMLSRVVVEDEEITEDEAIIDFYPNGSCSGGEVFLADEREREYRIDLDFLTGVVTIALEEET